MANYLLVYHGGSMPETPEEQAKVMQTWTDWFTQLGSAVVDRGNPTGQTKVVAADGSVTAGGTSAPSGYSIIAADDIDSAVGIAKGCPVLAGGAKVEVAETFAVM